MPAEFDLNSLIELQKDYAQDLDAIDKGGESNYVKKLNTELNDLHNTLQNSDVSTESILLKQKGVNNLLDSEISRLDAKKGNIEDAITGQKRLSNLNRSYSKKYSAINGVIIFFIFATIIYLALYFEEKYFNIIPSLVRTFMYILFTAFVIIYIVFRLADINSRDKMDFDKIDLGIAKGANGSAGDGSGSGMGMGNPVCVGQACCPETGEGAKVYYDGILNKCIQQAPQEANSGFANIFKTNTVKNFEPSEFTKYSKI